MRKLFVLILACLIITMTTPGAFAQDGSLPGMLAAAERAIYGNERAGSLVERVLRLERDVYGREQTGALLTRAQNLYSFLTGAGGGGSSVVVQLNVVEYLVFQRLTTGIGLTQRIEELERGILGGTQNLPLAERLSALVELVWPSGQINVQAVHVPAETLVRIRLDTEINSSRNSVGDRIRYRIVDDVIVDGRIVIPAGAEGEARVTGVQAARAFGQAGRVEIDWGFAHSFDGTPIRFNVSARAARGKPATGGGRQRGRAHASGTHRLGERLSRAGAGTHHSGGHRVFRRGGALGGSAGVVVDAGSGEQLTRPRGGRPDPKENETMPAVPLRSRRRTVALHRRRAGGR